MYYINGLYNKNIHAKFRQIEWALLRPTYLENIGPNQHSMITLSLKMCLFENLENISHNSLVKIIFHFSFKYIYQFNS